MTKCKSTEDMTPDKRRRLTAALQVELTTFPDGTVKYNSHTVNDRVMAARFGLSIWQVMNERRRMFGVIVEAREDGKSQGPMARAWEHIHALEAEVELLKREIAEIKRIPLRDVINAATNVA